MAREGVTIVIRKEEAGEAGHHGGAWKVAYADFVTAMMAFFLLMWLLNATTEEQRKGLADYFAPTNLFGHSMSGSGKPFGGQTPNETGTMTSTSGALQAVAGKQPVPPDSDDDEADTPGQPQSASGTTAPDGTAKRGQLRLAAKDSKATGLQNYDRGGDYAAPQLVRPADQQLSAAQTAVLKAVAEGDAQREQAALEQVGARLRDAIRQDPALQDIGDQLRIETIPEGLRVQLIDEDRQPMFTLGNAALTKRARDLIQKIVPALAVLSNAVSIAGHTDSAIYRGQDKTNWELSTERANTTRRLMVDAGLPEARIRSVTGNADRDLLLPSDPLNAANRRISIVVLRHGRAGTP